MSFTLDSRILLMYKNILLPDKDTWMWNRKKKRKFPENKDRDIISTARYKSVLLPSRVSVFPGFFAILGLRPGIKKYFDKQDFLAQ